ncbi:MAG TPA: glutaredoxin domain-containing protein [Iamia sp.]|jgi:glutaredoxin|nr:glutaredoxin domain-containing protein [Iamia sp.]
MDEEQTPIVRVYWRRGCWFCSSLRRQLADAGLVTEEHDIWADPDAAAFVRQHARGNETVPTVDVAGEVRVNPSPSEVLALARAAGIATS